MSVRLVFNPVFNVADSAITIGGVLLVLLALMGRDLDGSWHENAATA